MGFILAETASHVRKSREYDVEIENIQRKHLDFMKMWRKALDVEIAEMESCMAKAEIQRGNFEYVTRLFNEGMVAIEWDVSNFEAEIAQYGEVNAALAKQLNKHVRSRLFHLLFRFVLSHRI